MDYKGERKLEQRELNDGGEDTKGKMWKDN